MPLKKKSKQKSDIMKNFRKGIVIVLLAAGIIIAAFPPSQAIIDSNSMMPGIIYLVRMLVGAAIVLITGKHAFSFIHGY